MRYQGGKFRVRKDISAIINQHLLDKRVYVEPFIGGGSIFRMVDSPIRFGSDLDKDLIAFYHGLQDGWTPPQYISEGMWRDVRNNPQNYSPALVGYVSFFINFGGKKWGGYPKDNSGDYDYCGAQYRDAIRLASEIQSSIIGQADYSYWTGIRGAVIYCDPPYQNTTGYKTGTFDHTLYTQTCEQWASDGNAVICSEYSAPEHWDVLWSKSKYVGLAKDTDARKSATEVLYLVKPLT